MIRARDLLVEQRTEEITDVRDVTREQRKQEQVRESATLRAIENNEIVVAGGCRRSETGTRTSA